MLSKCCIGDASDKIILQKYFFAVSKTQNFLKLLKKIS